MGNPPGRAASRPPLIPPPPASLPPHLDFDRALELLRRRWSVGGEMTVRALGDIADHLGVEVDALVALVGSAPAEQTPTAAVVNGPTWHILSSPYAHRPVPPRATPTERRAAEPADRGSGPAPQEQVVEPAPEGRRAGRP